MTTSPKPIHHPNLSFKPNAFERIAGHGFVMIVVGCISGALASQPNTFLNVLGVLLMTGWFAMFVRVSWKATAHLLRVPPPPSTTKPESKE
jgi:hypothetical protein